MNRVDSPQSDTGSRTSSSLLDRVRVADAAAWKRLVAVYGDLIYKWCRQCGLQPADAADVGQEVFVAVSRKIVDFDHTTSNSTFRGWLRTITGNKVRDFLRVRGRTLQAVGGSDAQEQLGQLPVCREIEDVQEDAVGDERLVVRNTLAAMKEEFEPLTWQAFWLTVVEGQTAGDVAQSLGLTRNSVYLAKSRVLARLRKELDGLCDIDTAEG